MIRHTDFNSDARAALRWATALLLAPDATLRSSPGVDQTPPAHPSAASDLTQILCAAEPERLLCAALSGPERFAVAMRGGSSSGWSPATEDAPELAALIAQLRWRVLEALRSPPGIADAERATLLLVRRELSDEAPDRSLDDIAALVDAELRRRPVVTGARPRLASPWVPRPELDALRSALADGGVATVCSLTGAAGVGTSQLASAYAQRCENLGWPFVGWVNASSVRQATADLARLAVEVAVAEPSEKPAIAAGKLVSWLSSNRSDDRLLVFDQVADTSAIEQFVPAGPGMRVVIATTRPDITVGARVAVGPYSEGQAVEFLNLATGRHDEPGAREVSRRLGGLPAALAQAAATMRLSGSDYVHYSAALDEQGAVDAPSPAGVAGRLNRESVLHHLAAGPAGVHEAALRALGVTGLLADSGVPVRWLCRGDAGAQTREAIGLLVAQGVLTESQDGSRVSLPRPQREVAPLPTPSGGGAPDACQAAVVVLAAALPGMDDTRPEARASFLSLSDQLGAIAEQPHSALLALSPGLLDVAGAVMEEAHLVSVPYAALDVASYLDPMADVLGPDDEGLSAVRAALACCYQATGDFVRAIPLSERALADQARVLGADHPHTQKTRDGLAGLHQAAGNLTRTVALQEQSLAGRERTLGIDHPDTLANRNNLATTLQSVGDNPRALVLLEQTLAARERVSGADDPDTLIARNNLTMAYRAEGDLPRAIELLELNLTANVRVHGHDTIQTLIARNNLGQAYHAAGDLPRAIEQYEGAILGLEGNLGVDHPIAQITRSSLGFAYRAAGDLVRALPLCERTAVERERLHGPGNADTLDAQNQLACIYWDMGRRAQALEILDRIAERAVRWLGPKAPLTRSIVANRDAAHRVPTQSP